MMKKISLLDLFKSKGIVRDAVIATTFATAIAGATGVVLKTPLALDYTFSSVFGRHMISDVATIGVIFTDPNPIEPYSPDSFQANV